MDQTGMDWPHTNQKHNGNMLVAAWLTIVPPVILITIYLHLPTYTFVAVGQNILPKYYYYVFSFLLSPLIFLRVKSFISYLLSPIAIWTVSFLVLNCIHLSAGINDSAVRASFVLSRIQVLGLMILLGFAFTQMRRDAYEKVFVFLAVLLPCAIIADFLYPGFFYSSDVPQAVLGRAAATLINPTNAAEATLLTFILACPLVSKKYRSPLVILCGIAVMLTFSRSAMGAWLVIFAYLLIRRKLVRLSAVLALVVVSVPLVAGGLQSYLHQRADLDQSIEDIQDRLTFLSKKQLDDGSALERAAVLQAGWEVFLNNPATGIGAGGTFYAPLEWPHHVSVHNELVFMAVEYGIPGMLIWCWLGFCLIGGKYFKEREFQMLMVLLFLLMTPFTHTMLDMPYWLLTFMLVAQQPVRTGVRNAGPVINFPASRNV